MLQLTKYPTGAAIQIFTGGYEHPGVPRWAAFRRLQTVNLKPKHQNCSQSNSLAIKYTGFGDQLAITDILNLMATWLGLCYAAGREEQAQDGERKMRSSSARNSHSYPGPLPCCNFLTCSFNAEFSLINRDNAIANATHASARTNVLIRLLR
jgi:hypothetical protein